MQGVTLAAEDTQGSEQKATRKDLLARVRALEVENAILQLYRPAHEEVAYVQLRKAHVRQREDELIIERQARRLEELEAERAEWVAWKEAEGRAPYPTHGDAAIPPGAFRCSYSHCAEWSDHEHSCAGQRQPGGF